MEYTKNLSGGHHPEIRQLDIWIMGCFASFKTPRIITCFMRGLRARSGQQCARQTRFKVQILHLNSLSLSLPLSHFFSSSFLSLSLSIYLFIYLPIYVSLSVSLPPFLTSYFALISFFYFNFHAIFKDLCDLKVCVWGGDHKRLDCMNQKNGSLRHIYNCLFCLIHLRKSVSQFKYTNELLLLLHADIHFFLTVLLLSIFS